MATAKVKVAGFCLARHDVDLSTMQSSGKLIQRLIMLSAGRIMFSRGLQTPENFVHEQQTFGPGKDVEPISLPILTSEAPLIGRFVKWITAIGESIQLKYLDRVLMLVYCGDRSERSDVVETYTFNVGYKGDDNVTLSIEGADGNVANVDATTKRVAHETHNLFDKLDKRLTSLGTLPDGAHIDMRLVFTKRAPRGWQPSNFEPAEKTVKWRGDQAPEVNPINVDVKTAHHKMAVSIMSHFAQGDTSRPTSVRSASQLLDESAEKENARSNNDDEGDVSQNTAGWSVDSSPVAESQPSNASTPRAESPVVESRTSNSSTPRATSPVADEQPSTASTPLASPPAAKRATNDTTIRAVRAPESTTSVATSRMHTPRKRQFGELFADDASSVANSSRRPVSPTAIRSPLDLSQTTENSNLESSQSLVGESDGETGQLSQSTEEDDDKTPQ